MTILRDPDEILAAWLDEGPTRLPEQTRRAIVVAIPTTPQRRRVVSVPWRFTIMSTTPKLAVGAFAVFAVVLGGVFVLGPPSPGNVGTAPSPMPSPAASGLGSKIPKTIGKVVMSISSPDAATYFRLNPGRRLVPILTELGKTESDVEVAAGKRAGATPLLVIDAVRIHGVDERSLMDAFATAMAGVADISPTRTTIYGKDVVTWKRVSDTTAVYAMEDVLYFVQSIDADLVDQAVGALP